MIQLTKFLETMGLTPDGCSLLQTSPDLDAADSSGECASRDEISETQGSKDLATWPLGRCSLSALHIFGAFANCFYLVLFHRRTQLALEAG